MNNLKRVYKTTLKKAISKNGSIEVYFLPCKANMNSYWITPTYFNIKSLNELEKRINEFVYYCCNNQIGKYPHYYIKDYTEILKKFDINNTKITSFLVEGGSLTEYIKPNKTIINNCIKYINYKNEIVENNNKIIISDDTNEIILNAYKDNDNYIFNLL